MNDVQMFALSFSLPLPLSFSLPIPLSLPISLPLSLPLYLSLSPRRFTLVSRARQARAGASTNKMPPLTVEIESCFDATTTSERRGESGPELRGGGREMKGGFHILCR